MQNETLQATGRAVNLFSRLRVPKNITAEWWGNIRALASFQSGTKCVVHCVSSRVLTEFDLLPVTDFPAVKPLWQC